jgi:hypothetical protein
MITEDEWDIRGVELGSELLVEGETMSGDFHGVHSGSAFMPVVNSVIKDLVGFGCEVDTVLGESVSNRSKLAPI